MKDPLVSVIIPAYNAARFLTEAVASVLAQDVPPLEVLIADDGSVDATAALARSFGGHVRHLPLEHRGLPATRNRGLAAARGDLIAFLDADDVWLPQKQTRQLALLGGADQPDIVLGHTQRLWMPTAQTGATAYTTEPELAMSFGAAIIRRSVFERVGLFDESQVFADDVDWMMRARERGIAIHVHPEVVQYYRRHDGNMTNDLKAGNAFTLRMLKKSLDRRRDGAAGVARSLAKLSETAP